MAITKETVVDQVTVTENGIVLYREATRIIEDGKVLTQTYHRTSLTPGQDLAGTTDAVIWGGNGVLEVIDYKDGMGAVSAEKILLNSVYAPFRKICTNAGLVWEDIIADLAETSDSFWHGFDLIGWLFI